MYDELSVGAFWINKRYINDLFITTYCKFRNAAKEVIGKYFFITHKI